MRIPRILIATLVVVPALAFVSAAQNNDSVQNEKKRLQGRWRVAKWIEFGEQAKARTAEELKEVWFEFKGETLKVFDPDASETKYTLNTSTNPKRIDFEESGYPSEGIYKLEGDELTICCSAYLDNDLKLPPRPTEFKASANPPYVLFVLKRARR